MNGHYNGLEALAAAGAIVAVGLSWGILACWRRRRWKAAVNSCVRVVEPGTRQARPRKLYFYKRW